MSGCSPATATTGRLPSRWSPSVSFIPSSLAIGPHAYAAIRLETELSCEGLNCRLSGSLSPPVGGEPQSITEDNAAAARSRAFPRGRRDLGGKPNEYDDGSSSIGHSGTRPSFPSAYPVSQLSRSMIINHPQISGRYVGQITRFCCPLIICDQPAQVSGAILNPKLWSEKRCQHIWLNMSRKEYQMTKKRKHSNAEIAAKLAEAEGLATQGKLQSEIARALGVSVMTLHRWRKRPSGSNGSSQIDQTPQTQIAELQLENSRLRRLVTDLLLEQMKLEEASQVGERSMGWASP